ncbi:MAG TPA: hypothetical protein VFR55_02040 [Dehalococcoidia bacterium]|nr:hypothetical protein [Dehalococcoidia bacterium]
MANKYIWILGIFAASVLLSGGVGFWTFFADDRDPRIHSVSLEPLEFRFPGGRLQVRSEISDDVAIDGVRAMLRRGDTQIALVPMKRSDDGVKDPIYSAELTVPANVRSTGQSVDYTLQLLVSDSAGQESKTEVRFEVPAPGVPPAPPQLPFVD